MQNVSPKYKARRILQKNSPCRVAEGAERTFSVYKFFCFTRQADRILPAIGVISYLTELVSRVLCATRGNHLSSHRVAPMFKP